MGSDATDGGSRIAGALLRVGPCPGSEKLINFKALSNMLTKLRDCTDSEGIQKVWSEQKPIKDVYNALNASCRTAMTDLKNARQSRRKLAESKKTKPPPAPKPQPGKRSRQSALYQLEDALCCHIPLVQADGATVPESAVDEVKSGKTPLHLRSARSG